MPSVTTNEQQLAAAAFSEKHPGWQAWQSLRAGQWHARLIGSEPILMLHDDSLEGLSQQIAVLPATARRA
jgi:hypothetical protein